MPETYIDRTLSQKCHLTMIIVRNVLNSIKKEYYCITENITVPGLNPENSHELWIIPGLGKNFFYRYYFNTLFGCGEFCQCTY